MTPEDEAVIHAQAREMERIGLIKIRRDRDGKEVWEVTELGRKFFHGDSKED